LGHLKFGGRAKPAARRELPLLADSGHNVAGIGQDGPLPARKWPISAREWPDVAAIGKRVAGIGHV